ncbi:MAG: ORF6N domain-containing protein [candidate division FCPU426 bacterium]
MTENKDKNLIPQEMIENKIHLIRGKKIILDRDLAHLYQVETNHLTRQVRRNIERFPAEFMFVLDFKEFYNLKCHFGTSSWGGTRKLPYAFTEQGVAMLSSVLNSKRAIQVNIQIILTFTKLREMMMTHVELKRKIEELEQKYDHQFAIVFEAIKKLLTPPEKPKRRIGFIANE